MLAPDLIPIWSGIATYGIGLLKNMPKNVELHVITTKRELPGVDTEKEMRSLLKELGQNVKIYPVCNATKTLWDHARFQATCLRVLPELHKQLQFDLLHVNFPLMSEVLITITKRLRIPMLATIHTTIEGQHQGVEAGEKEISKLGQTDFANMFLGRPLRLVEYICLSNYSKLIATSNFIKKELEIYFPFIASRDIPVIHNGVDSELFHHTNDFGNGAIAKIHATNRPIILFTGRFVASKGIYTLVEAIPKILKDHPEALFVFAGGGDYKSYFKKLERKIREANCCFLGYMPWQDMPKLYSVASVYVMPTLYESFPLRLLESMACENAVVATNISGIAEVVQHGENGFLMPPKDSTSLTDAINALLEDPQLSRKIGKKARDTILKGFSAKIMTRKTLDVYNEFFNK